MSKHLLYCKDLLNRTLTRSLRLVLFRLVFCLIVLIQAISPAEAAGPLSVKNTNPRYFFDSKGNPVYLTGSYLNEYNMLSGSWDFASYLDFLQQQNQNFTRVWGWEQSPWIYDNTGQISFSTQPYERTGPGLALDGGLRFDLTRFNQAYFDQLRSRVVEAAQRGIYVSVMLFEGFSTQKKVGRVNPWLGDPFQQANNINGINGDPNQNGGSEEFFSLAFPSLVSLKEAFARKVVDTLNDLDNVLYEVNGNGLAGSLSWQYHMIDYIKRYQKKQANQNPVGISDFYAGATADVFNSSAEWIVIPETNLNPPPATSKKVLIMEGTPPVSSGQVLSTSPISLVQLLPDSFLSSQSSGTSNDSPSSNGVTLVSTSATSSTLTTTQSSSNQQSQVATPTITPNGGVYSGTVAVTLQTTTPGASIYYTTDGQSPTQSARLYKGKFTLSGSTLVKAKAFKNNFDPSSEASAWFANAASPAVSPSGLMAYWKFDEGSGTSLTDSSGNGNNGTLVNGPVWSAGRVGNALFFDGINDNVTVPDSNSLDLSSSFTLSAWVNPASTFTDFRSILVKNYSYYLYASAAGYCGDGNPLGGFSGATNTTVCQPSALPINTWTHLAVTYNGSALTLYRDGVAVTTATVSGSLSPTSGTLQLGGSQFGEYFKGLIDEVRIYNRALSAAEIQTIYQQDSATPVQTVATPTISPNGGSYSGSVSVTMQTATSSASIYYTTDGSTPTQSSTLYTGNMTLTSNKTVKAKAFKSGYTASAEASATFMVTQPFGFSVANSGDISVVAGSSVTNSITTTLTSGSSQAVSFSVSGLPTGATGSFSTASCSPTCSSTLTINTISSTAAGSSNITVSAAGGGLTKTTTFGLTVNLPALTAVATPTITPNGGSFTSPVSVAMQTATSGASIYYTTNGSSPTQSSTLYTGSMTLTSSTTLKAKAFKSGSNASAEASASFTVTQPFGFSVANSGDISVVAGSSVTNSITTTLTSGSSQAVSFSVSGLPSGATAALSSASCSPSCSSTLTINASSSTAPGSSTITVTASGGGITKTTTFSLNVSAQTVATPAISPSGGSFTNTVSVTMQTATSGASIYYTTNGSTPTQSSTLYNGAITLTSSADLKAKAFKSGLNPSAEASASFIVTPAGLVAYWKFDEGSGTSISDSSGNGNNGTLINGPVWSAGRVGKALLFDGINDNVTVPDSNSLDLSSSFTLSAWVNPASTFTDFRSILVKNYSYYLYASVAGYCGDGNPLGGFSGATNTTVCQPSPLPINTWTHLAVTYNGSTLTFYRDGVAVTTSTVSGSLSPTTGPLQIGGSQFGEYFNGLIDEVRIYNKALNDTEIQTVYQQDSGVASPTVPSATQPFSFSLSNSGNKSVVAGSSVTNSISATLVSGSTQAVSFSVSGLPSGATGSLSSTSCTPACSTVLNISTSGSTPAGNFPITITSTGGGVTKTTAFTLSVTVPTPTNTSGATYWVAKTGSDSNSCAQAQSQGGAKATINEGIGCLSGGDTLYIMPGTYYESIISRRYTSGVCHSFVCIPNGISMNQPTTISVSPGAEGQVMVAPLLGFYSAVELLGPHRFVKIYGFVFDGQKDQPGWAWYSSEQGVGGGCSCAEGGGCPYTLCELAYDGQPNTPLDVVLDRIEVRNWGRQGMLGWGSFASDNRIRVWITRSNIHHNGTDSQFDHGVYIGGAWVAVIGNQVHHNASFGMQAFTQSFENCCVVVYGNAFYDNGGAGLTMQSYGHLAANNIFYNTGTRRGVGYSFQYNWDTTLLNNTFYNFGECVSIAHEDGSNQHIQNNLCVDSSSGFVDDGNNNTFPTLTNNRVLSGGSSIFVNPSAGNFQLQSNATTNANIINQGSAPLYIPSNQPSTYWAVDAAGTARPQGGQWDVGACEWFAGAGQCPSVSGVAPPVGPTVNITSPASDPTAPPTNVLRVHPTNPRYFTNASGKAIVLSGHDIFWDIQDHRFGDATTYGGATTLDFTGFYIPFANARGLNYVRNWTMFGTQTSGEGTVNTTPMPWLRSSTCCANDGGNKFDLTQFNQAYFDRLRARAIAAGNAGIYMSIMIGSDSFSFDGVRYPFNAFNSANNINGVNVDANADGWGTEFWMSPTSTILNYQHAFYAKVIDTLNDVDNIFWETANEPGSYDYVVGIINYVKSYESSHPTYKRHLIMYSWGGLVGPNSYEFSDVTPSQQLNSGADLIAPASGADFEFNPPVNNYGRPAFIEMDHIDPEGTHNNDRSIVWKAFTRGYMFSLFDKPFEPVPDNATWETTRYNIGAAVNYANNKFTDLASMQPSTSVSSTGYALTSGTAYLIYQPTPGSFTINVNAANYTGEWYNPATHTVVSTFTQNISNAGNITFTPPGSITGDAVLYLTASGGGVLISSLP